MKKIYQFLAAAALLLSPVGAGTAFGQTCDGISWAAGIPFEVPSGTTSYTPYVTYSLLNNYAIVTGITTEINEVVIPSKITYGGKTYTVGGIADGAFNTILGKKITKITLPSTIETIGKRAFRESKLKTITLPSSLTKICDYAFYDCDGLTSITIPSKVSYIGVSAFDDCDYITSFSFASSSSSITYGNYAFYYMGSQSTDGISLKLPSYGTLGEHVLGGCKLKSLELGYSAIPASTFTLSSNAQSLNVKNFLTSFTTKATSIPDNLCVGYTKLTSVTIDNAATIGASAFKGCTGITSITIPSTAKTIGESAFSGCTSLATINSNCTYATFGNDAFKDIPTTAKVQATATYYMTNSFSNTDANPASITKKIYTTAGSQYYTIDASNYSITKVGQNALSYVGGITSIALPKTVTSIGFCSMYGMPNLTTVTLSSEATNGSISMGAYAFYKCSSLSTIENSSKFKNLGLYCLAYSGITSFDCSSLTNIPNGAFCSSSITSLSNTANIQTIDSIAFLSCTNLKNTFSSASSLQTIGSMAFKECTSLEDLNFCNNLSLIKMEAFNGCTGITKVYIPTSLKEIGKTAFGGCSKVEKIVVGDIAKYCNVDCKSSWAAPGYCSTNKWDLYTGGGTSSTTKVTKLSIPKTADNYIYTYLFANCKSITEIEVAEGITQINTEAFYNCINVTKVTLPSTLKTVKDYTFQNLKSLTSLTCNATTPPSASDYTFSGITYANVTLSVPADKAAAYKAATGWKNFSAKTLSYCDPVTIGTKEGKLVFKCNTTGATIKYYIKPYYYETTVRNGGTISSTGETTVSQTPYYTIEAWAEKSGNQASAHTTANVNLGTSTVAGDANGDGVANIADVTYVVSKVLKK